MYSADIISNQVCYDETMDKERPGKLSLKDPTDAILTRVADEVQSHEISFPEIQNIIDQMLAMSAGKGKTRDDSRQMVGLAAPQLGLSKCIVTIDVTADGSNKEQHLQAYINPKITYRSKETVPGREGCWSCGDICGNVERAKRVTLEGLDREGKPVRIELTDFVARIAQHETDHLEGIRFPDRIPADEPDRLHWVEPVEFDSYRQNWQNWPTKCPRAVWEALKAGSEIRSAN